ncbi:MAG: ISAs1 family transposase [Amaricoccus sp.]|nr:ISAs1 family transposase [Amaricoccus sp.]
MASLIDILGEIPDPRRGNARRHRLLDILAIALVASICGAESCVDFAEFAGDREPLLREFLGLENGLPSHDTFSRVFRLLDPEAFAQAFAAFLDDLGADGVGVPAIDGKTLRRSFDRAAGRSALHLVTAFGAGARVAIGQAAVAEGENEILAARAAAGPRDDRRRPRADRDPEPRNRGKKVGGCVDRGSTSAGISESMRAWQEPHQISMT